MMRAKFCVIDLAHRLDGDGKVTGVDVHFCAVGPKGSYPDDGSDENNTYAHWSPSATCHIYIANPALFDKFSLGQYFYVDFTEAEK